MKKKNYILLYSISIILLIILFYILLIFSNKFKTKNKQEINQTKTQKELITYEEFVCNNLEKIVNKTLYVYPEIINRKRELEQDWYFRVVEINGNESKVYNNMHDENGVMCSIDTEVCEITYLYCMDIKMIVPINYTQWEKWYK